MNELNRFSDDIVLFRILLYNVILLIVFRGSVKVYASTRPLKKFDNILIFLAHYCKSICNSLARYFENMTAYFENMWLPK